MQMCLKSGKSAWKDPQELNVKITTWLAVMLFAPHLIAMTFVCGKLSDVRETGTVGRSVQVGPWDVPVESCIPASGGSGPAPGAAGRCRVRGLYVCEGSHSVKARSPDGHRRGPLGERVRLCLCYLEVRVWSLAFSCQYPRLWVIDEISLIGVIIQNVTFSTMSLVEILKKQMNK